MARRRYTYFETLIVNEIFMAISLLVSYQCIYYILSNNRSRNRTMIPRLKY